MRALALAVSISVTGCSFAFVKGPPANHRELPSFTCTESLAVPVLDTIFTALELANFGLAAASSDSGWNDDFNGNPPFKRGTAIPVYAILTALGAGGMYVGYTRTSQCHAALAEQRARTQMQPPMQPGAWPPPGPPGAPPGAPGAWPAPTPAGTPPIALPPAGGPPDAPAPAPAAPAAPAATPTE